MRDRWEALREFLRGQAAARREMEREARDQGRMDLAEGFSWQRTAYTRTLMKMAEIEGAEYE